MPLSSLSEALGGLGLFILGMKTMSEGLQRISGERFRFALERITGNRFAAALIGSGLAVLLQSSTTASVIVIGFVNAGLISLYQALGVLLGTGLGATLAVQFIAFQSTIFAFPAILVGVLLRSFSKKRRNLYIGDLLLGAGLVFFGMRLLESGLIPVGQSAVIQGVSTHVFSWRGSAVLIGAVLTLLIQSNSVATGVIIAMTGSGLVNFGDGIAMIVGESLGIAAFTLFATINGTPAAKRTAYLFVTISLLAVALTLLAFPLFVKAIVLVSPDRDTITADLVNTLSSGRLMAPNSLVARHLANAHTLFNIFSIVLFLPLIGFFTRSSLFTLPGARKGDIEPRPQFLDWRVINTPMLALMQARNETRRMGETALAMFHEAMQLFNRFDTTQVSLIRQQEEQLDVLHRDISQFLVQVSRQPLDAERSMEIPLLIQTVNNLEHMGDGIMAVLTYLTNKKESHILFSNEAMEELKRLSDATAAIVTLAIAEEGGDEGDLLPTARQLKDEVSLLEELMHRNHVQRMRGGFCSVDAGLLYGDIIVAFTKITDHAYAIIKSRRELL
jgi:phosphate:Na+ symporter